MFISSEMQPLEDELSILSDKLRFALSLSPYSIPYDTSIGIDIKRMEDFNLILRHKVTEVIKGIGAEGQLTCTNCTLENNTVKIIVEYTGSDDKIILTSTL